MHISMWLLMLLLAVSGVSSAAHADEPQSSREEAHQRFDRGLQRFAEGDYASALAEFERAVQLVPNAVVRFNIGLVYATLGRPVEAASAMQQVLRAPGALSARDVARAEAILKDEVSRIAEVSVTTNVPASVDIDGIAAGQTPLTSPLRVSSGRHIVTVLAVGYVPLRRELIVAGGTHAVIDLTLTPTDKRLAHVTISAPVVAADVWIDDTWVGQTPLAASLALVPGAHRLRLSRPGYVSSTRELQLADGSTAIVELPLAIDPSAPPDLLGELALRSCDGDVHVAVDGAPRVLYRRPLALPAGPHRVQLTRAGFEPVIRNVAVLARQRYALKAVLMPTPETRQAYVASANAQTRAAWIVTASGMALITAGATLGIWAHASLPALSRDYDAALASFERRKQSTREFVGNEREQYVARIGEADAAISDRETLRSVGLVTAGVGIVATVVGVVLLVRKDDPARYDRPTQAGWTPAFWARPNAAGANLSLRF